MSLAGMEWVGGWGRWWGRDMSGRGGEIGARRTLMTCEREMISAFRELEIGC